MKQLLSRLNTLILFVLVLLASCKKDPFPHMPEQPAPGKPSGPAVKGSFFFAANPVLVGQPYHSSNLTAVVSVQDNKGVEVITEKMVTLTLEGGVKSAGLELPAGDYLLTRFRLVYGSVMTHFAAPVLHSPKASAVQKPLSLPFKVLADGNTEVPVEVIRVEKRDRPEAFGYPRGAFDNNQEEESPYIKVQLRTEILVGGVLYDSIPAGLTLTTHFSNGEMATSYISLKAGINEISLLKTGVHYDFHSIKWGVTSRFTLKRGDINPDSVYVLGGSRDAKKLKSEVTYRLVNGHYVAESKNEYLYDASGRLATIHYYEKDKDNRPFLALRDQFHYSGDKVVKIERYNEQHQRSKWTSFHYDVQGRVSRMEATENGNTTNASVTRYPENKDMLTINYTYSNSSLTLQYGMLFQNGVMTESGAHTSNGNNERGRYSYDAGINPYFFMNWPDLFLSHSSKHNLMSQYVDYYGSYPSAVPYNFEYKYDGDGHPTELVKKYKSFTTNTHTSATKTTYTY